MMNRGQIDMGGNQVRSQQAGDGLMSMDTVASITTAGAGTLTAAALLAGVLDRTGPGGNYIDTLDTADNLMAAAPNLSPGDSFRLLYRNTVAFTQTLAVAEGAELSGSNTAMVASNAREYLIQILATGRRQVFTVASTNASAILTGLTQSQASLIQPGMGVSGTGMPAAGTVIGVNSSTGTVTLSGNATATGTPSVTFFPRYSIKGLQTGAL
jgi:hypothetical protein